MKVLCAFFLIAAAALAQSQTDTKTDPPTLADLGLVYALSNDWILATTLMREHTEEQNGSSDSLVLAAVYVPQKKPLSLSSPFFTLFALHHLHPDCTKFLDAMALQLQKQEKTRITSAKQAFSVAGRDYYRTDFEQKGVLNRRAFICTAVKDYVLIWNAGARDEKGVQAVVSTLDAITSIETAGQPARPREAAETQSSGASGETSPSPKIATPVRVRIASGVSQGLIVKKVPPTYPAEARAAYIQGTVILKAEISKEGDIVNLELLSGPIELAGSAVDAVRRWKYRPYLFNGEPVKVDTQIQVNYQLR